MTITRHEPVHVDPVRPLERPPRREDDADADRRLVAMRVPPHDPADDVRTALRARRGKTWFELASRGGYARTVVGRVAYLDVEAQTYMVLGDGEELLRVPLRDITSRREEVATGETDPSFERDAEGLGTG
jgi:hypothetical protein